MNQFQIELVVHKILSPLEEKSAVRQKMGGKSSKLGMSSKKKITYNETFAYSPFTPSLPTLNRTIKYRT